MKIRSVTRLRGAAMRVLCVALCSATMLVLFGQVRTRPRPRILTGEIRGFVIATAAKEVFTDAVPSAHGGARWHASTVRAVSPRGAESVPP